MSGRSERQLTDSTDDSQITDDSLEEPGKLRTLSPHLVSGELEGLMQWSIHHWSSSSEAPCFAPACTQRTPLVSQRQYNANSPNKYYPVEKQRVTLCLVSAAFFSALGSSFLYGYNLSVVNAAAPFVMEFCNRTWVERYGEAIGEETSTFIWSITVAIFCVGGACGAILSTVLVKYFGRKGTLLLNNSFALTGCLMMSLGEKADSFEMIIFGRIIIGVNSGISLNSVSMYLAEISPVHIRGSICQLNAILVNSGILVGQVLGLPQLFGQESRWNFLFAFIALPSVLQLCVLPHLPESPRYLLIEKNDEVGAERAFRRLLGKQDVSQEMEEVWAECRAQSNTRAISALSLIRNPAVRWQIITVVVTMACYQLCGFNALFYYTDGIFDEAGIEDDIIPYITLSLGGTEVLVSIFTGLAIERYGRRRLFVFGYVGMAVSLSLLTLFLNIQHRAPWIPWLSFGSILLVIASFCLGPAGASFILTGELFEQSYRPAAFMIGGTVSWICNFTVGQVFPFIEEVLQTYVFLVFVGVCSLCAIYIFIVLPETKNKTFREVSRSFATRNKVSIPEIQKDYIPIYRHGI